MVVRYEGDGDDDPNNDPDNLTPDLELVDRTTTKGEPYFGKLCTLLSWHKADPVSDWERDRNNVIYQWQGNRNPFIDHPEFVSLIWGDTLCP